MDISKERVFIESVDALPVGARAALRRAGGRGLVTGGGDAISAFYQALPSGVPEAQEERWFIGACIRCLWKPEDPKGIPMQEAMGRYSKTPEASDSFSSRMAAILDTPWDMDGFLIAKLWRMARLLKQKGYVIDAASLIEDLRGWNAPTGFVQRQWARAFYMSEKEA